MRLECGVQVAESLRQALFEGPVRRPAKAPL
jgi:hypothetical protein